MRHAPIQHAFHMTHITLFGEVDDRDHGGDSFDGQFTLRDGRQIEVQLYANLAQREDLLHKVDAIAQNLQQAIDHSAQEIARCCQPGGIYEEKMQEYLEFVLFECQGKSREDFSDDFQKPFGQISPQDFAAKLHLYGLSFSLKYNSVVFDYLYTEDVYELWVVTYDLDLNFIDMTVQS